MPCLCDGSCHISVCVCVCWGVITRPRAGDKHRSSKFGVGGTLIMRVSGHVRAVAGKITTPLTAHPSVLQPLYYSQNATLVEQKRVCWFQIRVVAIATEFCPILKLVFVFMFSCRLPHFSNSAEGKKRKVCVTSMSLCQRTV